MRKYLLVLFIIGLTISACSPEESSASLIGSWRLDSYGSAASPVPAVEGSDAQLTFNEDGSVTGNAGCNGFGGDYTVERDQITFGQIVSTLILCEEPFMEQEETVHQVLTDTATFNIEGNTLTLTNNERVLVLER